MHEKGLQDWLADRDWFSFPHTVVLPRSVCNPRKNALVTVTYMAAEWERLTLVCEDFETAPSCKHCTLLCWVE